MKMPDSDMIEELLMVEQQLDRAGRGANLTMRGVRENVKPRMSVGMLFTNWLPGDLHQQHVDLSNSVTSHTAPAD